MAITHRYIGLDVHRDSIYVTVFKPVEGTLESYELSTRKEGQIREFERQLKPTDRVALEATTNGSYWYQRLTPQVGEVALANPAKLARYRGPQAKTDRIDSSWLAVLLALGCLPTVWVPDEETQRDRELLQRRDQLVQSETREKNRTRSLLLRNNLVCPHELGTDDARRYLNKLEGVLSPEAQETLNSYLRQLDSLRAEIFRIEQVLYSRADRRSEMELLLTIPGVGLLTGMTILAAIGDIARFRTPGSLCNYAGLVPKVRASANRCHHGRVARTGSKSLRRAVSIAVASLVKRPGRFRDFYQRLLARRGPGTAMAACARKLLTVIWHMLTRGEAFRDRDENLLARKRARVDRKVNASKAALAEREQENLARQHLAMLMDLAGARRHTDAPVRLRYIKLQAPPEKVLAASRE